MRRTRRIRRSGFFLVILSFLAAAGLLWLVREEPLSVYAPEAYVERADRFIEQGFLRANCSGAEPQIEEHFDEASEAQETWYEESYLSRDVLAFNREPESFGWYFVIDESCRLLGVNPVVHTVRLPFGERFRWLGTIFYGGGVSDARLRSPLRPVTLRHPETPVPAEDQGTTEVQSRETLSNEGAVLFHFAGGPAQPAARVHYVGREVVVANRAQVGQPAETRLLGVKLPLGRLARLAHGDWLHLEHAGRYSPRRETFVFLGGEALEAASTIRLANTRYDRDSDDPGLGWVSDPVRDRTYPYMDLVAQSVESSLAALEPKRARELERGFDLQITLERNPQERLSKAFRRAVGERARKRGIDRPVSAGLTVLDGKTGEVLVLATHPSDTDLADEEIDSRRRRRLLQNQNLVIHPIGSAGKPFLFTAITQAHPFLLDLVLDPHPSVEKHRQLFHCELTQGYEVGGAGAAVDFRRALEISSNRYAVELATLALAADRAEKELKGTEGLDEVPSLATRILPDRKFEWPRPGESTGIRIGGTLLEYAPNLGSFVAPTDEPPEEPASPAAVRCNSMDRLELASFGRPLGELTGASIYRGEAPPELPEGATRGQLAAGYVTGRYDLRPWRPLLAHLLEEADAKAALEVRAAAQSISPERVNLALNQVSRLREGFVSLILGGGNSSWTNVQLTEALARLVTGRSMEARMARRVLLRDEGGRPADFEEEGKREAAAAPLLSLRPEVRMAVLEGMKRVVEGAAGTANDLADELAALRRRFPEDRIEMYAKTGSPVVLRPVPPRTGPALERLIARRYLVFRDGLLEVQPSGPDGSAVTFRRRGAAGRTTFVRGLRRALAATGSSPGLVRSILPIVDEFSAQVSSAVATDAIEGPLRVQAGGVLYADRTDSLFRQSLVRDKGAVLIFALVRLPGAAGQEGVPTPEQLAAEDAKVLTVALHLDVGPNSGEAVAVAEILLERFYTLLSSL